jgi:hypothetical protein
MARRSPTESHSYWGSFALPSALPNVLGSSTQSVNLEAGDTAFSLSDATLYVCLVPTQSASGAVWSAIGSGTIIADGEINLLLDSYASFGAPELVGAVYIPTARTVSASSRALLGVSGDGQAYQVDLRLNVLNVPSPEGTVATFSMTAPNGFYDVPLQANVDLAPGWYDVELDCISPGAVAFARGLYLTV